MSDHIWAVIVVMAMIWCSVHQFCRDIEYDSSENTTSVQFELETVTSIRRESNRSPVTRQTSYQIKINNPSVQDLIFSLD